MTTSITISRPGYNYLGLSNYLNANLARYTASEAKVAHFCIERTARFNKRSERVPMRHMLQGIPKVIAGLGLARNTIKRALKGLEQKGFLVVHPQKDANGRDAAPKIEIVCKMTKLRISKKHRAKELGEGSTVDHLKEEKDISPSSSSSRTTTNRSTRAMHAVVDEVKKVGRRRRRNKAQRQLIKNPNTANVAQAWKQLCVEYGLDEPSFTKATAGRVTGQLRHHERSVNDSYEFMEWCIQNWALLKKKEFKKWDLIKPTPEISVWGMAMSQFVGFYATREYYDRVKAEDLPATTVNELERQLETEKAEHYTTRSKLSMSERVVQHYRGKKNGR